MWKIVGNFSNVMERERERERERESTEKVKHNPILALL